MFDTEQARHGMAFLDLLAHHGVTETSSYKTWRDLYWIRTFLSDWCLLKGARVYTNP